MFQWHFGGGDGADDQVERFGVFGRPVGFFLGCDEAVGAHLFCVYLSDLDLRERQDGEVRGGLVRTYLHGIIFLYVAPANHDDLVCSQRFGVQDAEMAQPSESHDSYLLPWPASVVLQGRIHGDTSAQHGRCLLRWKSIGDLENEMGWDSGIIGVTALGDITVGVLGIVSPDYLPAMVLEPGRTLFTVRAEA